jgi:hypothetical protein
LLGIYLAYRNTILHGRTLCCHCGADSFPIWIGDDDNEYYKRHLSSDIILIANTTRLAFSTQSHVGRSAEAVRFSKADTYVGNIHSAVMGGIGPSPAVLGANFKDTVEKFLTLSATHNSMTKAAFIAIATHATLHGIKSE